MVPHSGGTQCPEAPGQLLWRTPYSSRRRSSLACLVLPWSVVNVTNLEDRLGLPYQSFKCGLADVCPAWVYPAVMHLHVYLRFPMPCCSCVPLGCFPPPTDTLGTVPGSVETGAHTGSCAGCPQTPPRRPVCSTPPPPSLPMSALQPFSYFTIPALGSLSFHLVTAIMYIPCFPLGARGRQIAFYCLYSQTYYVPKSV